MASPFELTETGITTPTLLEARAFVVELWKDEFGQDAQTASDSPDGLQIDIITLLVFLVWQGAGDVYANFFVRTAGGVSLDLLLEAFGKIRLGEQSSQAEAFATYGTPATVVPAGTQYTVGSTAVAFETDADVTLLTPTAGDVFVYLVDGIDGSVGQVTGVSIDVGGGLITPLYITTGGEDNAAVASELADAVNADAGLNTRVRAAVAGLDENGAARLVVVVISGGPVTAASSPSPALVALQAAAALATLTATVTGPVTADVGELDVVNTPVAGMDGGANYEAATVGRNTETDAEYKLRHFSTLASGGCGSPQAIRAGILENAKIDGIQIAEAASVVENTSDVIDPGPPVLLPHSFLATVLTQQQALGNAPSQGELDAIAAEIFRCKPAGIATNGAQLVTVTDELGNPTDIQFDVATVLWLWLEITITPGEGFPTSGDLETNIAESVAAFLSRGGEGELSLGDDLERYRLGAPITEAVPEVKDAAILTGTSAVGGLLPPLAAADIIVSDDTVLAVDVSRITVIIL